MCAGAMRPCIPLMLHHMTYFVHMYLRSMSLISSAFLFRRLFPLTLAYQNVCCSWHGGISLLLFVKRSFRFFGTISSSRLAFGLLVEIFFVSYRVMHSSMFDVIRNAPSPLGILPLSLVVRRYTARRYTAPHGTTPHGRRETAVRSAATGWESAIFSRRHALAAGYTRASAPFIRICL